MASVSYLTVGSNNLERAKGFYDALLGSIGMRGIHEHASGGRLYSGKDNRHVRRARPLRRQAGLRRQRRHGRVQVRHPEEVAAFYNKAIELGGTDEGAPGERSPGVYFAYFRDLDGNKLCGYKFG